MKFIHLGDVHLASNLKNVSYPSLLADKVRERIWQTFEEVLDEEADLVFLSGDLIEADSCSLMDKVRLRNIFSSHGEKDFYWSLGNHDSWESLEDFLIDLPKNVNILAKDKFSYIESDKFPLRVYGLSYISANSFCQIEDVKLDPSYKNVLLLHGDLDQGPYLHIPVEYLENAPFDYCALGHIHRPNKITDRAFYAGILEPRDFGEPGEHGYIRGDFSEETLEIEFVNKAGLFFQSFNLMLKAGEGEEEAFKKLDDIVNSSEKSFLRIVLQGEIENKLKESLFFQAKNRDDLEYLKLIDQTEEILDIGEILKDHEGDLIGEYIYSMEKYKGQDFYREALDLGIKLLLEAGL